MMILFEAAELTGLPYPAPPKIIRRGEIDYPRQALDRSLTGYTRVRLTVAASGKLIHCDILDSSGDESFDAAACKGALASKAKPALDVTGKPILGTIGNQINFIMPSYLQSSPPSADISLVVNHLPAGAGPFVGRDAALTVDAAGNVTACNIVKPTDSMRSLDTVLCQFALSKLSVKPALDEDNKPAASIQTFSVEFSRADSPAIRKLK